MGSNYKEPQLEQRSVFVLSEPVQLPSFQALASLPTLLYRGLLVSSLVGDELRKAMRRSAADKATLGTFWEASPCKSDFNVRMITSFSTRDCSETALRVEYCGSTVLSDASIMQQGSTASPVKS
jgi:hypothetical protein